MISVLVGEVLVLTSDFAIIPPSLPHKYGWRNASCSWVCRHRYLFLGLGATSASNFSNSLGFKQELRLCTVKTLRSAACGQVLNRKEPGKLPTPAVVQQPKASRVSCLRLRTNKQEQKLEMIIILWAVSKCRVRFPLHNILHSGLVFCELQSIWRKRMQSFTGSCMDAV